MDKTLLSVQIPAEWKDRLERLAAQRGGSLSEVIRAAVLAYLETNAPAALVTDD